MESLEDSMLNVGCFLLGWRSLAPSRLRHSGEGRNLLHANSLYCIRPLSPPSRLRHSGEGRNLLLEFYSIAYARFRPPPGLPRWGRRKATPEVIVTVIIIEALDVRTSKILVLRLITLLHNSSPTGGGWVGANECCWRQLLPHCHIATLPHFFSFFRNF